MNWTCLLALSFIVPVGATAGHARSRFRESDPEVKVPVFVSADYLDKTVKPPLPLPSKDGKVSVRVRAVLTHEETGLTVFHAREIGDSFDDLRKRVRSSKSLRLAASDEEAGVILTITDRKRRMVLTPRSAYEKEASKYQAVYILWYRLELAGTDYAFDGSKFGTFSWAKVADHIVDKIEDWIGDGIAVGNWLRIFESRERIDAARDLVRKLTDSPWLEPVSSKEEARIVVVVKDRCLIGYRLPVDRVEYRLTVVGTGYETEAVNDSSIIDRGLEKRLEHWVEENYQVLVSLPPSSEPPLEAPR